MREGGCVCESECARLHGNGNLNGIFVFISSVNSSVGTFALSSFRNKGDTRIFCACKWSQCLHICLF